MVIIKHQLLRYYRYGLKALMLAGLIFSASLSIASSESSLLDTMKPYEGTTPSEVLAVVIEARNGARLSLTKAIDRPMLVNLWASWCPACIHELPDLEVLNQALDKAGMGVMLVGLDRQGRAFGEDFLAGRDIKIERAFYENTDALPRALQLRAMPTSFLVTPDKGLIGIIEGPRHWADPDVIKEVQAALTP